jgi:signal transduction histidine kinase
MAAARAPANERSDRRVVLARVLFGIFLLGILGNVLISILNANLTGGGVFSEGPLSDLAFVAGFATFPIIGYVLATRQPDNAIGWVMLAMGLFMGLPIGSYAIYAIHGGPGGRDLGLVLQALDQPGWIPVVAIPATFLLLLFPDGHLPSPRWRWFARILGVGLVFIFLAILVDPAPIEGGTLPGEPNPLGLEFLRPFLSFAYISILIIPIGAIGSVLSLVLRFRRSTGIQRLQLRWLVTAASVVSVIYAVGILLSLGGVWTGGSETNPNPAWLNVIQSVSVLSFALIPIAIGVSILRYRLFDIDVVINRALLFGALAVFVTLVYVAIVVGIGTLVGGRTDPVLSAAAAAVVALAFQPARRRGQRLADRLVYGKRATPYEVLSEFSERVGNAYATEELLPRMARALASGTGAARTDVWVRLGDRLRSDATWPEDGGPAEAIPLASAQGRSTPSSMLEPVRHQGELLGALSIEKKPGDAITATEEKLVRDLAAQAGLVMRNVALTEQLLDHIDQLRASRQRLVAAQDQERRRLERNLHDGAQQQLVALSVKLRLAEQLADRDPAKVGELLASLQSEAGDALENLRDLARGIYPPLLADKGLVAALESQARKSAVPVTIEADGIGRYPQEAEAAVYFSCLEALQNVAKYASASHAIVSLSHGDGRLRFEVTDDGVGFEPTEASHGSGLQGIADRLAALDGEVEISSTPGAGTTVTGELSLAGEASSTGTP